MSLFPNNGYAAAAAIVLLLAALAAGCTAPGSPAGPGNPSTAITPSMTDSSPGTAGTMVAPMEAVTQTPTPKEVRYATYSNAGYGLTIRYPEGWSYNEPGLLAFRDYGRTTLNIVNFYTPSSSGYCVFSVDIDSPPGIEIEDYFNKAVLSHQDYYGSGWDITKHNYQFGISRWPGYRLDYMIESKTHIDDEHGLQVYVYVGNTPYIFTYKGPESSYKNHLGEALEMMKQTVIVRTTETGKSR